MVKITNFDTLDALIDATVPSAIKLGRPMDLGEYSAGFTESEFIAKFKYAHLPHLTDGWLGERGGVWFGRWPTFAVHYANITFPTSAPPPSFSAAQSSVLYRCLLKNNGTGHSQSPLTTEVHGKLPIWS